MNRKSTLILLIGLSLLFAATPARSEINEETVQEMRTLYPLRIRDMSFPGVMILGFDPSSARRIPKGTWFYETHYSQASNFMVSNNVEKYLKTRDDNSMGIGPADIAALEALDEEVFFFDGEVARFDFNLHFGLTDHLELSGNAGYISYTGGDLDAFIFNFHENFGIDQNGRDLIAEDQFTALFIGVTDGNTFARTSSPGGGISDPTIRLRWGSDTTENNWNVGVEGAVKIPLGDEDQLHSSGNADFGVQFAANKSWVKTGLVINAFYVVAGDFEQAVSEFEQSDPLGFSVAYMRTLGKTFTLNAQAMSQRNLFDDATDSSLSDPEFQLSVGFTARVADRSFFQFSYTNNFINYDNTPDLVFHAGFSQFFN